MQWVSSSTARELRCLPATVGYGACVKLATAHASSWLRRMRQVGYSACVKLATAHASNHTSCCYLYWAQLHCRIGPTLSPESAPTESEGNTGWNIKISHISRGHCAGCGRDTEVGLVSCGWLTSTVFSTHNGLDR